MPPLAGEGLNTALQQLNGTRTERLGVRKSQSLLQTMRYASMFRTGSQARLQRPMERRCLAPKFAGLGAVTVAAKIGGGLPHGVRSRLLVGSGLTFRIINL